MHKYTLSETIDWMFLESLLCCCKNNNPYSCSHCVMCCTTNNVWSCNVECMLCNNELVCNEPDVNAICTDNIITNKHNNGQYTPISNMYDAFVPGNDAKVCADINTDAFNMTHSEYVVLKSHATRKYYLRRKSRRSKLYGRKIRIRKTKRCNTHSELPTVTGAPTVPPANRTPEGDVVFSDNQVASIYQMIRVASAVSGNSAIQQQRISVAKPQCFNLDPRFKRLNAPAQWNTFFRNFRSVCQQMRVWCYFDGTVEFGNPKFDHNQHNLARIVLEQACEGKFGTHLATIKKNMANSYPNPDWTKPIVKDEPGSTTRIPRNIVDETTGLPSDNDLYPERELKVSEMWKSLANFIKYLVAQKEDKIKQKLDELKKNRKESVQHIRLKVDKLTDLLGGINCDDPKKVLHLFKICEHDDDYTHFINTVRPVLPLYQANQIPIPGINSELPYYERMVAILTQHEDRIIDRRKKKKGTGNKSGLMAEVDDGN